MSDVLEHVDPFYLCVFFSNLKKMFLSIEINKFIINAKSSEILTGKCLLDKTKEGMPGSVHMFPVL